MQYNFLAIGDTTTDAFIKLKAGAHVENEATGKELCLNFGDKIEYEHVDVIHGVGNAGNAAVSAARLGLSTALATYVGADERGEAAKRVWSTEGITTEYVYTHSEFPTHYHFVLRFGPERTILIKHEQWPYVIPETQHVPEWVYFSSIGEHGEPYHHELAKWCKDNGIKLAFQPGTFQISLGMERIADVYAASEIFFCNKEEAQRITGLQTDDIPTLAQEIRNSGVHIAVITDGPRGAYATDERGVWRVPMYPDPAPPVDRTGAGDAFSSTVVAMLASGKPLEEALLYGPINSMSVVQKVGAQEGLLSTAQIEELLKSAPAEYRIERIA